MTVDIRRVDKQTVAITGLDLLLCELIQQIPVSADPGDSAAARARIYSSPTHGAEPEFDTEWEEYVAPDLRELFQSAVEIVQEDLADFPPNEPQSHYTLRLGIKRLESWVHALNQARLALAARYNLNEADMDDVPAGGDARALATFQVHFYGYLQECFLRELD